MNNTHNNSAKKNLNKTNQKLSDEKNINRYVMNFKFHSI